MNKRIGEVVNLLAVEELLDGDKYHAVTIVAGSESESSLLYELREMVHEIRASGYLSASGDCGAIAASTQAVDDEKTTMQLIRDELEEASLRGASPMSDVQPVVDGVTVYPVDELPPGVVVAVATDALAGTPPGVLQPFIVRDRRGVEIRNVNHMEECDDSS